MKTYPQKITFCEMRDSDVRDVLIYCRDHRCSHDVETTADVLGRSCAAVGYRAEKKPPLKVGQRRLFSLQAYFSLYVPV